MTTATQTQFKETEIGLIPEEWSVLPFEKAVSFNPKRNLVKGKLTRFVAMTDIEPFTKNIKTFSIRTFSGGAKFKNGDTLMARITPCLENGKTGFVDFLEKDEVVAGSTEFIVLTGKDNISDSDFVYYLSTSPSIRATAIKAMTGTSGRQRVENEKLAGHLVQLPPIDEQKQIAEILSSLDDKIELNRKINANLEKLAATLFKKWFVDIGDELPEGWRMGRLSEVADISIGRTPPRMEKEWFSVDSGDVKWISIRDLGNSGVYVNRTAEYLTRETIERFNIPVIPKNTVILSFKLTVGRVAITTEEMLSNEAIAHIKLTDKSISPEYIYLFLKSFDFSSLGSTSSIATAVNSKSIKEIPAVIPDEKTGNNFTALVQPIFENILENTKQIEVLSQIRDSLLPRLMSGKIRV